MCGTTARDMLNAPRTLLSIITVEHPIVRTTFDEGAGQRRRQDRWQRVDAPKGVLHSDVVTESVGPVCSPAYLGGVRLQTAADLGLARLMVSRTRPHAWTDWLRCGGHADVGPLRIEESFEHFYLLIQAAKCGLGMANVPRMLVRDDLSNGTLVAPLGFSPGSNKLAIRVAPHLSRRPDTVKLVDWLTDELRLIER